MAARQQQKRKQASQKPKPPRRTSDRAIYLGILIIGFFFVMLASLFTELEYWSLFALGYLAFIGYLINVYTFQVCRGGHLANWQQALARIPLRFVGYGTKDGKPLEAAHHHHEAKKALMVSVVVSVAVLAGLAYLATRSLR